MKENYYRHIILSDTELYIVGNPDNGFFCEKSDLEKWEKKMPCDICRSLECERGGPSLLCSEWLKKRLKKKKEKNKPTNNDYLVFML